MRPPLGLCFMGLIWPDSETNNPTKTSTSSTTTTCSTSPDVCASESRSNQYANGPTAGISSRPMGCVAGCTLTKGLLEYGFGWSTLIASVKSFGESPSTPVPTEDGPIPMPNPGYPLSGCTLVRPPRGCLGSLRYTKDSQTLSGDLTNWGKKAGALERNQNV